MAYPWEGMGSEKEFGMAYPLDMTLTEYVRAMTSN